MDAVSSLGRSAVAARPSWRVTPLPLALGLAVLALVVRLIGLDLRPLWLDEAYSAWFSGLGWHELWVQVPTYEPHPPFYYSLLKLWRGLFGGTGVALRAFSILLAMGTVPLVLAASAELERQSPSGRALLRNGLSAFLAACSPALVLLGQEARPYPLLIFAYALATLGLLRLLREFAAEGDGSWPSWLMLAAGTELALWAHALGLLYALCLALALAPAWLARPLPAVRLVRGFLCAAAVALLYLPCLIMVMNRAGDWGHGGWLSWQPSMALQLLSLYALPVEVLTIGTAAGGLAMLLLVKRAVQASLARRCSPPEQAVMLLWWGPPLLAMLISQLFIPIFLPRTLAATIIPACIATVGTLARIESSRERLMLAAAVIVSLSAASVQIALRPPTEDWDQVAAYLNRQVKAGDEIWLYPNDSALPLRAAGLMRPAHGVPGDYPAVGFRGPIRAGSPAVVSVTADQANAIVGAPSARTLPTIWLVTRQWALFDPKGVMPAALGAVRRPGGAREWNTISVRPYYRR